MAILQTATLTTGATVYTCLSSDIASLPTSVVRDSSALVTDSPGLIMQWDGSDWIQRSATGFDSMVNAGVLAALGSSSQLAENAQSKFSISNIITLRKFLKQNQFGMKSVSVIGDSISYGAIVSDIQRDSYVGIFKKLFNLETGYHSQGWNGVVEIATVLENNAHIIYRDGFYLVQPEYTYLGCSRLHSDDGVGKSVTFKLKKPTKKFKVCYEQNTGYGSLDVIVNGVTKGTISTAGTANKTVSSAWFDTDGSPANVEIKLQKKMGIGL